MISITYIYMRIYKYLYVVINTNYVCKVMYSMSMSITLLLLLLMIRSEAAFDPPARPLVEIVSLRLQGSLSATAPCCSSGEAIVCGDDEMVALHAERLLADRQR